MTIKLTRVVEQTEEFDIVYAKDLRLGSLCYIDGELQIIDHIKTSMNLAPNFTCVEYRDGHTIKGRVLENYTPIVVKMV